MIAITGHASGIGRALFEKYPGSLGFDLTNGYNIDSDIDRIIDESKHCEVFINNAYHLDRQTDLLRAWYQRHKDDQFLIINISSIAADLNFDVNSRLPFLAEYAQHKRNLNKLSFDINCWEEKCRSATVLLAKVDTNFPVGREHQDLTGKNNSLDVSDVVNAVNTIINSRNHRSFISSITLSNL